MRSLPIILISIGLGTCNSAILSCLRPECLCTEVYSSLINFGDCLFAYVARSERKYFNFSLPAIYPLLANADCSEDSEGKISCGMRVTCGRSCVSRAIRISSGSCETSHKAVVSFLMSANKRCIRCLKQPVASFSPCSTQ